MIYVNGRFLSQQMTGVHRYAYELCKSLTKLGMSFEIIMPPCPICVCYNVEGFVIKKFGLGHGHIWEQLILPFFFLLKRNYVLLNFTGLGPIVIANKIITIHDLAFVENPSWYSKQYVFIYNFLTPLCAKTSKLILTVSEFSKKEIIRNLGIKNERISVIYNAANISAKEQNSILMRLPEKYILAVSSLDPRKNFEKLIRVFSQMPDYNLVVVGGGSHVFGRVKISTDRKNIIFLGRVSDAELTSLYKNALAFIFPSLYEGFGIPPIEAMSYGCPVIASDIEVLHEVCGDAAVYINQLDENDIRNKIVIVSNNDSLRISLREKGFENIKRFSWTESAKKILRVISKL